MKYEVKMPSLGADMEKGKLMEWRIKPGDEIKKGETIAVVETTKSAVEIESFRDGKVMELIGKEGDEINVGATIAYFDISGEEVPAHVEKRPRISPAAKKLAESNNIDIMSLKGTGPQGQIELKDVETMLPQTKRPEVSSVINLREAIGRAMSRSKKEIPHYYLKTQVRLDYLLDWVDDKNKSLPPDKRLMVPVVLVRAIILALKDFPELNGYYDHGKFEKKSSIHLGLATSLKEGGVLVPAIIDAHAMSLSKINDAFQDLLIRTRKGELKNRELTEGTVTVTNVGELGSDEVFGVIFPPQVALIGLGRIRQTGIVDQGNLRPGFVIDITLSADHRVSDGLYGARFLSRIERNLLNPHYLEEQDELFGNQETLQ